MLFDIEINGTPCQCEVTNYMESTPMIITGAGFGDAIPPEGEEFDYRLLDDSGDELDMDISDHETDFLLQKYKSLTKDELAP